MRMRLASYQLLPAKTLVSKDDKCVGAKTSKERVTLLVSTNMDGTDKRELLLIEKSHKPWGFATIVSSRDVRPELQSVDDEGPLPQVAR